MEKDLTKGSIKKHYFTYLTAAFGSALISSIYGMVDSAVVGHYAGPDGSAALAIVMPIWTIIYALGLLIGIGGSVAYGFYKGQEKTDKANAYFTLSLLVTGIISILCWVAICAFDDELLYLFGADDKLLSLAKEYLTPVKYAIPVFPFTQMLAAFLRNDNAPSLATKSVLFGGIFNVVGDLLFVFEFDMGMFGAGLATALGATLSVIVMLTHFFDKKNTLKITRIYGQIHKTKVLTINGFSAFLSDISMGVVSMLFNRQIMKYLGSDALAVFGVITQMTALVQCSTYGAGQAAQPILSNNFGANLTKRVKETNKYGILTAIVFGIVWTMIVLTIPNGVLKVYMSPTKSVLQIAPDIMRVYGLSYLFLPLNIYSTYYFQSIMRSKTALMVSAARGLILCGILVYLLPFVFGSTAIWWVMPIVEIIVAIFVIFSMGEKKLNI